MSGFSPEAIERVNFAIAAGAILAPTFSGTIAAAAALEAEVTKPTDDFPCCSPGSTVHELDA